MIKLITFDVDGTLLDTDEARYLALLNALKENGVTTSLDFNFYMKFFYLMLPLDWTSRIAKVFRVSNILAKKIFDEWSELFEQKFWRHGKLFANAKEELEQLKELGLR